MLRFVAVLALILASPASAQDVVADLSQTRVSITTSFSGSEILVFGAVKATEPTDPLEVIVTISGPSEPVTVRKKDRIAGIWVNTESINIDSAPTLYKVATTKPLPTVLTDAEDQEHLITVDRAIRFLGVQPDAQDSLRFTDALIRIRQDEGLYGLNEGDVRFLENSLFSTTIELPANLVEGDYTARIFLTLDREVVATHQQILGVRKVGLERWIYGLAHSQPLIYGLLSLAIAIFAGWGASTLFRYILRT